MSDIIVIERDLLKSEAFRQLNGSAKTILFDFRMRCRVKGGNKKRKERVILNNGELVYPYSEAERKGIPRSTFMRAIDDLVASGFIDIFHSGSGGRRGDCSLYGISERWRDWGTERFKPAERPKDSRTGRGFQPGNKDHLRKHGCQK